MPRPGPTTRFFLLISLFFFGGIVAWPALDDAYGDAFRRMGQKVHGIREGSSRIVFHRSKGQHEHYDTRILLTHPEAPRVQVPLRISSYHCGYKPTVVLLALLLATRMSWRKRAWVLPAGLVLAQVFVLLRLWLMIGQQYTTFEVRGAVPIDLRWMPVNVRDTVNLLLSDDLSSTYVIPIAIWALLVLRWRTPGEDEAEGSIESSAPTEPT